MCNMAGVILETVLATSLDCPFLMTPSLLLTFIDILYNKSDYCLLFNWFQLFSSKHCFPKVVGHGQMRSKITIVKGNVDVFSYFSLISVISSAFRRKQVELLSSLQRQRQCLGRLNFRLSFLSESISQKLSKVSIWNLEYLFTIKSGTNYNKVDDLVICISRVICSCFDIIHRN